MPDTSMSFPDAVVEGQKTLLIANVHLVIVNISPANTEFLNRLLLDISTILKSEIHCPSSISNLLTSFFHTIWPVKQSPEEQNANYDVEIFHSSIAHTSILGNELKSTKEGGKLIMRQSL
ncbi:hypothetical protein DMENIID0001_010200 [Sergentomyia squamirostris]